jgi:hypothetical protein
MAKLGEVGLKAGATVLTLAAAVASAIYVSGHVRNGTAPLHPTVIGEPAVVSTSAGGRLSVSPSVRSSDVESVTSTYAS